MFARGRVTPQMADTFRVIVMKQPSLRPLVRSLELISGPGPTAVRAATDQEFLSTVIQCKSIHVMRLKRPWQF